MNARIGPIAGILLATAAGPFAAVAADIPAASTAPLIVAAGSAAPVASQGCPGEPALSPLQQRLLAKYDLGGVPRLLQYVWITRNIHELDRVATAQWAEDYRIKHPAC